MKKFILLLIVAVAGTTHAWTQEYKTENQNYEIENNNEIRTIFSKGRSNGGYGAFTLGYSEIGGKDAFVTGARGAFIFNHSLAIGLGGYGFINDLDDHHHSFNNEPDDYSLAGGYGGIFVEPIIAPSSPVHISFPVLFGIGGVALVDDYEWLEHDIFDDYGSDVFLVFEPAVEVEFNLAKFFRTAIMASYRITSDIDLHETKSNALNGLTVGLTFKLGKF